MIPVIFLAFANDRVDDTAYLRNLPKELDGIRKSLYRAQEAGLCEVVERANATVDNILDVFQDRKYRDRISIFHYGGHANGYQLLLESADGENVAAKTEGLVPFLARQIGLKLIFLNGCSSQQQAYDLIEAGIPAVIGTSQSINDDIAMSLSIRFYHGLGNGAGIDKAWQEAIDEVKIHKGTANMRDFFWEGMEASTEANPTALSTAPDRFPWDMHYKQGAEIVKLWNLPEQVGNPLFNLPEIPKVHNLPESPFLFLKRYERRHARVFFGRSYYIRELYNKVADENIAPVILLYGQSGVGKSSLFDAGLNPRLETSHTIKYVRRDAGKGLLVGLEEALFVENYKDAEVTEPSEEASQSEVIKKTLTEEEKEADSLIEALKIRMVSMQGEVKEQAEALIHALERKRDAVKFEVELDSKEKKEKKVEINKLTGLLKNWHTIEKNTGKPLLIILDQAEELFTRPLNGNRDELEDFLNALERIFGNPRNFPKGKLILGYRKEFNPEIEEGFKQHGLPRTRLFLEHLSRKDIVEIFHGLTGTADVRARYNLDIEEELPVIVADDLLEDKNSAVAPVLQILMTKMWAKALEADAENPKFTVELYQKLRREGILLDDFFYQQMMKLRAWASDLEISGLALDVLNFHTTRLGTAGSRNLDEIRERYQHKQDIIDGLIDKFKELYLLNDSGKQMTGLAHDTIAPLIQSEFRVSDRPGQRATRILENKILESDVDDDTSLDITELDLVESGYDGMRYWVHREQELVEKSRKRKATLIERKRRLKRLGVGAVLFMIVTSIFGLVQWNSSKKLLKDLAINSLEYRSNELQKQNPTLATGMAFKHYNTKLAKEKDKSAVEHVAKHYDKIMRSSINKHFYQANLQSRGRGLLSAHFSPNDNLLITHTDANEVQLWNAKGELLNTVSRSLKKVLSTSFIAADSILIAYRDGSYKIVDKQGDVLAKDNFGLENLEMLTPMWHDASESYYLLHAQNLSERSSGNESSYFPYTDEYYFFNATKNIWRAINLSFLKPIVDTEYIEPLESVIYAVSPDGSKVFAYFHDLDQIGIAFLDEGYAVEDWAEADFTPSYACFSPDGMKLCIITTDDRVLIYSETGELLNEIKNVELLSDNEISAVFSSDGEHLLIPNLAPNRAIGVFKLNGEIVSELLEENNLISMGFSSTSRYAYKVNEYSGIQIWDMNDKPVSDIFAKNDWIYRFSKQVDATAAFSNDGENIFTTAKKDTLWTQSMLTFKYSKSTLIRQKDKAMPAFHNNRFAIVDGIGNPLLCSYTDTLKRINFFEKAENNPNVSMEFSPDGKLLAVSTANYAKIYDTENEEDFLIDYENPSLEEFAEFDPIYDIDVSNNGMLAIIRATDLVEIFDIDQNLILWNTSQVMGIEGDLKKVCISKNEQYLAIATKEVVFVIDKNGQVLDRSTDKLDDIKDIRFAENDQIVHVLTAQGIYKWSPIGRFLPRLKNIIANESLQRQVEAQLKEFDGKVIYSILDPIFHRKTIVYLILAFLSFILINRIMYDWDHGMHLKVWYATPTYLLLVLYPLVIPRGVDSLENLQLIFNCLQMILVPILIRMVYLAYIDFIKKDKRIWAVTYVFTGIALGGVSSYFLLKDYFNIISNMSFVWVALFALFCIFLWIKFMQRTVKAWYNNKKTQFVIMNILYGLGATCASGIFIYFLLI